MHVRHVASLGLFRNDLLGLAFSANEEERAAARNELARKLTGLAEARQRVLQIDDVDTVAFPVEERLHVGVPTAGLVAKVNARLEQLLHRDRAGPDLRYGIWRRHRVSSSFWSPTTATLDFDLRPSERALPLAPPLDRAHANPERAGRVKWPRV